MSRKIVLFLGAVIASVCLLVSCLDSEEPKVDVPVEFSISQSDEIGVINVAENFSATLGIDPAFTGSADGHKFTLEVEELSGFEGELLVNGSLYANGVQLTPGSTTLKYTSDVIGFHQVVFMIRNEVGKIVRDTFKCNIKEFPTVAFTVTATKDLTANALRPGAQKDITMAVTTSAPGTDPYYLSYSAQPASIYISALSQYVSGDALPSRSLTLKLNIPDNHPDGTYVFKGVVSDKNNDEKTFEVKYKVLANKKPTINEKAFVLSFPDPVVSSGSKVTCDAPDCYSINVSNPGSFKAWTEANLNLSFSDSDGSITDVKITRDGVSTEFAVSGGSFSRVYSLGYSYWQKYLASTSGSCAGTANAALPVNGKILYNGSTCGGTVDEWLIAPGKVFYIQVKDNEGLWSDEYSVALPSYDVLKTNKPASVTY